MTTEHPYAAWTIDPQFIKMEGYDSQLVGKTIWLLTPVALKELPDGHEVISILCLRKAKEQVEDDVRGGFLAYGLLPEEWRKFFGSAVDKLADLA